jgi:hypothetical protein
MTTTPQVGSAREHLAGLGESIRGDFERNRRVLSFGEYLELVLATPARQLRSSAQYLVDCLGHYGTSMIDYPWGEQRRFRPLAVRPSVALAKRLRSARSSRPS